MNRVKTFMGREILVEFALLFEGARRSVRSRYVSTPRRGNGAKAAKRSRPHYFLEYSVTWCINASSRVVIFDSPWPS